MANFPQNPSADDTHQIGDKIWTWDGEKWFADYDSLSPVFQAITAQGMVDTDAGSDFKLALDADILSVLNNPAANTIGNVTVTGDQSPVVGNTKTYSFNNDGTLQNNLVGTYTCTVPGSVVVLNTVEFTQIGTGKVLVEVNHPDATDAPVTAEMDINVVAVPTTIGLVTIDSDSGNFSPDQGDVVTYSYTVDGDAVDYVGVLSALGAGASVSGDTVTWTGSGQAEVRYDVTSATAADSPRHNTEIVNVAIKPNIGDITLSGNTSPVVGTTENYTAFYNGTATGVSSQWTADPALGATPNPIIPGGFDFSGSTVGATGDITVTYTAGSAWDSPKSESISVTVAAPAPPFMGSTGFTALTADQATVVANVETEYLFDVASINIPVTFSVAFKETPASLISGAGLGPRYKFDTSDVASGSVKLKHDYFWDGGLGFQSPNIQQGQIEVTISDDRSIDPASKFADVVILSELIESTTKIQLSPSSSVPSGVDLPRDTEFMIGWLAAVNVDVIQDPDRTRASMMTATHTDGTVYTASRMTPVNPNGWANRNFYFTLPPGDYRFESTFEYQLEFDVWTPVYYWRELTVSTDAPNVIGNVTVIGNANPTVNSTETYSWSHDGTNQNPGLLRIDCDVPGAIVNDVDITFPQAGSGNVTVLLTHPSAADDPQAGSLAVNVTSPFSTPTTYTVTVTSTGYGNKYVIDGVQQDSLTLTQGNTYIFDQSDSSNSGHPLKIYTDSSKSTEVTAGVTIGSNSTTFVPGSTGTYSYQCAAHANMGGDITVQ